MDQPLSTSETVDFARVAQLVRPFESLELRAVPRPGGGWSIGYGHVRSARAGAEVTRDDAEALLLYDLRHVAQVVGGAIYAPVNRHQLEALIAFAFHIGTEHFLTSTALHRFNAGDSLGAALEIERWRRAEQDGEAQLIDVMVRRRAAEKAHFLTPPEGFPKASRVRLRPQFDTDATASMFHASITGASEGEPSASLAAAHSVSARLRALLPDVAEPSEPPRYPEREVEPPIPPPAAIAQARDPVAVGPFSDRGGDLGPILPEQTPSPPELEIPPPPMPFEDVRGIEPDVAAEEVWPAPTTNDIQAGDPFVQGPLDATSIEAPALDRSAADSSLFRPKPEHRTQIPPRPEPERQTSPHRPAWATASQALLWGGLALGLAAFVWAIWSILKTSPSVVNFIVGLLGIALMAVPAYLLLGAHTANSGPKI
jgi:lysozyme